MHPPHSMAQILGVDTILYRGVLILCVNKASVINANED